MYYTRFPEDWEAVFIIIFGGLFIFVFQPDLIRDQRQDKTDQYRKRYKDHRVKERLPESFVKGLICKKLYVIVQSAKLLQLSEHIYFIRASDDRFYKRAVNKRYDHDKPREQVQIRLYTPYNFFLIVCFLLY